MARETMDPELLSTCKQGDVENLKKLYDTHRHDYEFFLTPQVSSGKRNILHVMLHYDKQHPSFIKEALEILPIQVVRQLICLPNSVGDNPLHQVAYRNKADIHARLLVDAYNRSPDVVVGDDLSSCPPWRAKNNRGQVPAQLAISCNHDEVAAFLVSLDTGIFKFLDADMLLRESIVKGCIRTVNVILTSNYGYSIEGFDPRFIENECHNSDVRCVSLLQHHPKIANYLDHSAKKEVLARATGIGAVNVVKAILNIDISNSYSLLIGRGKYHLLGNAVSHGCLEIAHLILDAFNKSRERQAQEEREAGVWSNSERATATRSLLSFRPLWSLPDRTGDTPLSVAFRNRHRKLAVDMLLSDFALLSDLADICDEKPLIIPATEQQVFKEFIEGHMKQDDDKTWIMDVYMKAILRFLRERSDDNKSRKLIKRLRSLIGFKDASGRPILQCLLDENDVYAICHENQSTILHHVKLRDLEEYQSLLHIPEIAWLKNKTDAQGRSPLIKAIEEDNIYLAQALLEVDGIDFMYIKRKDGKPAAALLKDKSKQSVEWDILHNKLKQTTSYIMVQTELKEMRSTLSVVAALLATITFAAAFTVPGGFNQDTGEVLLGQRASFIVFLLSDTYAMCCSMIVLYFLIWSMVWDFEKALLLIDRSVSVLHQSLYGTLVAFMTGVYTMMSDKTLWVAIVVCVISSCVPIIANRRILITILDKYVRTSRPESRLPRPVESSIDPSLSAETSMDPIMSAISVQR